MAGTAGLRKIVCAVAVALVVSACGGGGDNAYAGGAAPPVEIIEVQSRAHAETAELPGRIEPVRVAEVRARVPGIVLKREFDEGSEVSAGQVLFRIDPASLQATLSSAQGELAKAEAELHEAQSLVDRYAPLADAEAISRQDYDAAVTRLKTAQAGKRSVQGTIETARLNLGYATVRAPIAGRIGRALVTEGALVGQNESTPMALIQQLDPVYADFKRPVGDVLRMRAAVQAGQSDTSGRAPFAPVTIEVPETGDTRRGELLFSDISVDPGTGQVSLRGVFENKDGLLLPGMFVRVKTAFGRQDTAIFVPQRAVQRSPGGDAYVVVVDASGKAQTRPVVTGEMSGSDWQILEGLTSGERIVTSGAAKLQDGMQVETEKETNAGAVSTPES